MSDFIISMDACGDLPDGYAEEHGVPVIPMPYTLKMPKGTDMKRTIYGKVNKNYDIVECRTDTTGFLDNMKGFFDTLRNGALPHTSQANSEETTVTLEPFLKAGKDVLHIAFSSKMSGSYNSAEIAAKDLREKYPDRKLYVMDSRSGAGGYGLVVMDAVKMRDEGASIEETYEKINAYTPCYHHYFTLNDIGFIARSGRINSFEYMFASILNITIILGLDSEGKVFPAAKVRGRKNVYKKFMELFETLKGDADNSEIILSHGDDLEGIKALGDQILEKHPDVKKIDYTFVNQMVGCNSGPDSLALFFRGKPRELFTK